MIYFINGQITHMSYQKNTIILTGSGGKSFFNDGNEKTIQFLNESLFDFPFA